MRRLTTPQSNALVFLFVLGVSSAHSAPQDAAGAAAASDTLESVTCPQDGREKAAWYVGPYKGRDNTLTGLDLARDAICADRFKQERYPNGFVAIYGSSKITEFFPSLQKKDCSTPALMRQMSVLKAQKVFNATYATVQAFAHDWTAKHYGDRYPILTGAGPGLMEAGSRGAHDAHGPSIGYTTYYDRVPDYAKCTTTCYTDVPKFARYTAPGTQEELPITSDGLIFSSVSMRETAMILHSSAIVIAPGGTGTEWEIYQILEMLKSKQLAAVPIYFVGQKEHWESFQHRIDDMVARGTLKEGDITPHFAVCAEDLTNRLAYDLKMEGPATPPPPSADAACKTRGAYEIQAFKALGLSAADM